MHGPVLFVPAALIIFLVAQPFVFLFLAFRNARDRGGIRRNAVYNVIGHGFVSLVAAALIAKFYADSHNPGMYVVALLYAVILGIFTPKSWKLWYKSRTWLRLEYQT